LLEKKLTDSLAGSTGETRRQIWQIERVKTKAEKKIWAAGHESLTQLRISA